MPSTGAHSDYGSPAEVANNLPDWHPADFTLWVGTRVISEHTVLHSELYLNPNCRCTLQIRGGMQNGRSPVDDGDFPTTSVLEQAHNGRRHPMRTLSFTSKRANNIPVQQEIPVPEQVTRLVYTYGEVVGEDREDIEASIEKFNAHPGIQRKCERLERAGLKYLRFASWHGTGIAAKIDVSQNTELCYYLGAVYSAACNPAGNHCMDIGSSLCVNATRVVKDLPLGCSMHMANQSCNPNCRVILLELEDRNNDLVLLVLVAMLDIVSDEAITLQYKGSMWQLHTELSLLAPSRFRWIHCRCDQPCPNFLARLDWIETGSNLSPKEVEQWYRGRKYDFSTKRTA
jgi:hypothetical protein